MKLTKEQEALKDAVGEWHPKALRREGKGFYLATGPAGTGKSSVAAEIVKSLGVNVATAAPTGKAMSVLAKKGMPNCTTLHKLLYSPRTRSRTKLNELEQALIDMSDLDPGRETLLKEVKAERKRVASPAFDVKDENPARQYDLIIVDEVSMIDGKLGSDLMSLGVPVLAFGDGNQLPPVRGKAFFDIERPDFLLTEIHRQSKDNPIIRLATDVREGRDLEFGTYGSSVVIPQGQIGDRLTEQTQIIVGTNKTTMAINRVMRRKYGRTSPLPEVGDKLLCLQNDHNLGCLNGTVWIVKEPPVEFEEGTVAIVLESESDKTLISAECYKACFDDPQFRGPFGVNMFGFGYSLTCHKSQGSQWDNVLILDESRYFKADKNRWLYTAITRAAESVTIVKNYSL